MKIATVAICVA